MKAIDIGVKILSWVALLSIITLCWVGAECIFEGVVHTSAVDGGVACLLAFYMLRDLEHIDKEIVRRRDGDG